MYRVLYTGKIKSSADKFLAKETLAQLVDDVRAAADALGTDGFIVLQENLTQQDAEDLAGKITSESGLVCRVEAVAEDSDWSLEPIEEKKEFYKCPACDHVEPYDDEEEFENHVCSKCGIVGSKYDKYAEREKTKNALEASQKERLKKDKESMLKQDQLEELDELRKELAEKNKASTVTVSRIKKKGRKNRNAAVVIGAVSVIAMGTGYFLYNTKINKTPDEAHQQFAAAPINEAAADSQSSPEDSQPTAVQPEQDRNTGEPSLLDHYDQNSQDMALGRMAAEYIQEENLEEASRIALHIDNPALYAKVLGDLAVQQTNKGELKQALNNFVAARAIADQIKNEAQKVDALSSLAQQHAETGQYREAKKIFSEAGALANNMEEPEHKVKMLSLIASHQSKTRFINQANANLQQALLISKAIPIVSSRMKSMGYIAKAWGEIGLTQKSENLFRDMLLETQATQMENTERDGIIKSIALQQAEGDMDAAVETLETVQEPTIKSQGIFELLDNSQAAIVIDGYDMDKLVESISDQSYRMKSYAVLAKYKQFKGLTIIGYELISKAELETTTTPDDTVKSSLYSFMGKQLIYAGSVTKGARLFNDALTVAAALSDPEAKDMALSIIANDQASAHLFEESMITADAIGIAPKRDEVRKSVSALQAKIALLNNHPQVKESNE